MKRSSRIAIFFCLLLMIFFSFSFPFFRAYMKSQKAGFRTELSNTNSGVIKTLEIERAQLYKNVNGIEWEDNNKEIIIGGKYHDVLSVSIKGGRALIKLVSDEKESSLFDNFFAKHKEGKNVVISFLKMFCAITGDYAIEIENNPVCFFSKTTFSNLSPALSDFQYALIKPPCLN